MKIIKDSPILNSAIKAWNGEEKLWKVLLWIGLIFFCLTFTIDLIDADKSPDVLSLDLFFRVTIPTLTSQLIYFFMTMALSPAIKAWNGEEKLWKVFWLFGVLLYPASIIIGLFSLMMMMPGMHELNHLLLFIMSCCGVIMLFIYPTILIFSMNRCSNNLSLNNRNRELIIFLSKKIFPIFFMSLHFFYTLIVGAGTIVFITELISELFKMKEIGLIMLFITIVLMIAFVIKKYKNSAKKFNDEAMKLPFEQQFLFWLPIISIIVIIIACLISIYKGTINEGLILKEHAYVCLFICSFISPLIFIIIKRYRRMLLNRL